MPDLVFLAIATGFFALCALYVNLCDRIIGPDPDDSPAHEGASR